MKYLVITKTNTGTEGAIIFDKFEDANSYLHKLSELLKYPIEVKWRGSDKFIANITNDFLITAEIIRTERAEYRLSEHSKNKDQERRFFVRQNVVKYINSLHGSEDIAPKENESGDWTSHHIGGSLCKLYAVILDPTVGSNKVLHRFSGATGEFILMESIGLYAEESVAEPVDNSSADDDAVHKNVTTFKKNKIQEIASKIYSNPKFKNIKSKKRKSTIIAVCAAVVICIVAICVTDWQVISDEIKASSFQPTAEVEYLADSLKLTRKGRAAFFASQPKLLNSQSFNRTCGRDGADIYTAGCYYREDGDSGDEHIEIFDTGKTTFNENGLSFNYVGYQRSVALHEMLHAAWERLPKKVQIDSCLNLETLASDISGLRNEMAIYSESQRCTELFARVGSEYISVISPGAPSTQAPLNYYSLNSNARQAAINLIEVYNAYFDTTYMGNARIYWENNTQLENYGNKINQYKLSLDAKRSSVDNLINLYYRWPTYTRLNNANSAINEYNSMVNVYNSYLTTYNKLQKSLDSEENLELNPFLGL